MAACRSTILGELQPRVVDLNLLGSVHGLCYVQINEEDALTEFGIRRSAFIAQQKQTGVLMWMVIAITISGVLLAGIQLLAAYKLAASGKAAFEQGGQLSLENNKISLTSSVTGVLVLFISLFFFYIFVKEVYLIKEVGDAPAMSVARTPNLRDGWSPGDQGPTLPQLTLRPFTPAGGTAPMPQITAGPMPATPTQNGTSAQGSPVQPVHAKEK
jgi:hypothetical protein